ncbi:glycosyltransferase family 4 protein [Pedobacter sp. L105]|uniref:MraY family glycosyltransferase n=1 Tax=Pedobacter sp. L105 TaxID=1641871 RepID=UPI00131ADE2C|nr:glycosyltransferase family 4 protein [Pedobacter sp. L105]
MSSLLLLSFLPLLFTIELLYFIIADYFGIIDKPNHRSSHSKVTLRGGGVIFSIALLIYPLFFGYEYRWFLIGLTLISVISFADDIKPVSNKLRIVMHLAAVSLMFFQLQLWSLPWYWVVLALFFVIGSINAINFMDGINGITGSYALIAFISFLYINMFVQEFINANFLLVSVVAVMVFNFFNFRTKAKCFAGDVGSVSIAFIILFILLELIIKSQNFNYLLLLLLYGLDAVTTIVFRLFRKENIFDAHRSHFYQYLANERKWPHLIVSSAYAITQLILNVLVILWLPNSIFYLCCFIFLSVAAFIIMRFSTEGAGKLLGKQMLV